MRNLYRLFSVAALAATSFLTVGCIEEVEPTSVASAEQLSSNSAATEAYLWAMPAYLGNFNALGAASGDEYHYDYGVGSVMHMRDCMTGEYVVSASDYDWYDSWEFNEYLGPDYVAARLVWQTYYKAVLTANALLKGVPNPEGDQLGYVAQALTFRAGMYLDMARMYEFMPTSGVTSINAEGNDVQGLTCPIVDETISEEEARKNPRATHDEMFNFIKGDLEKALGYFEKSYGVQSNILPSVNVANGLLARLYLWHASYMYEMGIGNPHDMFAKSAEYAIAAMEGYTPMSQDAWTNPSTGFNTPNSSWLWSFSVAKENDAVQTGICNWISWVSNETTYGYASAGPMPLVDPLFYDRISDTDFRKLSWKAPEGSKLNRSILYANAAIGAELPEYASLKFRPGQGNVSDYNVGSAVSTPLMRVEEMYFIKAEAEAQMGDLASAVATLKTIMQTRNKKYSVADDVTGSKDKLIDEIIFQKFVEFWGEGLNYFDYKRLNLGVNRGYEGTLFAADARYNVEGRPAWMNWVIPVSEINNNDGVRGKNSPDPSGCYKPWESDGESPSRICAKQTTPHRGMKIGRNSLIF